MTHQRETDKRRTEKNQTHRLWRRKQLAADFTAWVIRSMNV